MLPPFYGRSLDTWSDLNNTVPYLFQEIVNEIIWKNKFLCVDKISVFRRYVFFFSIGLLKVRGLLSCNNTATFSFTNLLLNPEQFYFIFFCDEYHWLHPSPLAQNNKKFFVSSNNFSSFRCSHHHYRWKFSDIFLCLFQKYLPPCSSRAKKQGLRTAQKQIPWQVPTLRHRLGEGLFSILQLVCGISVQDFKLYCYIAGVFPATPRPFIG